MEINQENSPEQKGGGLGPVIIISAALIGIIITLKFVIG